MELSNLIITRFVSSMICLIELSSVIISVVASTLSTGAMDGEGLALGLKERLVLGLSLLDADELGDMLGLVD